MQTLDTPTISVEVAEPKVPEEALSGEATSAQFKVKLSGPSAAPVTVSYGTLPGTAIAGKDFKPTKGKLTFNPGETEKTILVAIMSDALDEDDETFQVKLSGAKNATLPPEAALTTCTIVDTDVQPTLSIADLSVKEGNSKQTKAKLTVTLSAASGRTVTVNYATASDVGGADPAGSTAPDMDYLPVTTPVTLTFAPGTKSRQFTILVNGDKTYEPDETFLVNLSGATNATLADGSATVTIKNDDALPAISIDNPSSTEGPTGMVVEFTVTLAAASELPVSVDYATADKTAKAGTDYQEKHGTLTFDPGQTTAKVSVYVYGGPSKTFSMNLSNAAGGTLRKAQGIGTIKGQSTYTLFAAGDSGGSPPSNVELWRTDGTPAGTKLVKDINAGHDSSDPLDLTYIPAMKKWFFSADDGVHGREPWVSDGTAGGTKMIKDVYVQGTITSVSSIPTSWAPFFTYCNGYVYFAANGGPNQGGHELWRTNGTAAGTTLVANINHLAQASEPAKLTAVGNQLYFVADDGVDGRELWVTNGTSAGTHLVKDIYPGSNSSRPERLTNVNGRLFFVATDIVYGTELWTSDGTDTGTVMVKDINAGPSNADSSNPRWLTSFRGKCYFAADDGTHGTELWQSDGTADGTFMVKNVNPAVYDRAYGQTFDPGSSPANLIVMNDTLYFSTLEVSPDLPSGLYHNGSALYKSDGTADGTVLVKQINTDAFDSEEPTTVHLEPMRFTVVGRQIFFIAGTHLDQASGTNENVELWRTDGTADGTYQVKDIFDYNNGSSKPSKLRAVNGRLVFFAYSEAFGREPWVSNGTDAGTTMLKDINPTGAGLYGQDSESYGRSYDGYLYE